MDRIETFKAFIAKQPDDPFPVYSVAMEYAQREERENAQVYFDLLLEKFPDYVAAYFHAGANLQALGRKSDARARYELGIEVASRVGQAHARSELADALDALDA